MLFAFLPSSPRRASSASRRRIARALLYGYLAPAAFFSMPTVIAEFFRGPLIAELSADMALSADGRVVKDASDGLKLATIHGTALVNPATPVTARSQEVPPPSTPTVRRGTARRPAVPIGSKYRVLATAYSSTPDQTDASPFITASGTHVHDGTVATNFLPFGTHVRFLNYRPDMVFTVEDRHHPRLSDRVDLWFETRQAAFQFGKRVLEMEIVE